MGIALMMSCSGTPAENRSTSVETCVFTFPKMMSRGSVYMFTYNGQEFMIASDGYEGGITLIQINK